MADTKLKELEEQLKAIGCNFRFWGRAELRELANVLLPGEVLMHCVNGSYEGGFALLAATDQRVLLVDKKPMYLTLEDVRFDMITEIDFNHRLMNANVFICTPNKSLRFVAYNHARLRKLFHYVQTRVAEIRQHYTMLQSPQQSMQPALPSAVQMSNPQLMPDQLVMQQAIPAPEPVAQLHSSSVSPDMQPFDAAAIAPQSQAQPTQTAQELPGPKFYQPTIKQAAAYRVTAPVISAYTRLPLMSKQRRRFLGSRAMNSPQPSMYQ
jgi:hypothetical protein